MDYRQNTFKAKFTSAGQHLGVTPDQVISLKLRDSVSSYSEYHEMLQVLEHEAGLHWSEIDGELQGRGYLIDHDGQKMIVVEHETGLEILYIAGSVASLIGLIPIVLQSWAAIHGHFGHRHAHHSSSVEMRRLDSHGNLQEDHSPGLAGPSAFALSTVALSSAAKALDADMLALRQEVRSLGERLAAVEKRGELASDNATARGARKKTEERAK